MPREPRQIEIGGIYHIINRAVEGREIFCKPQDFHRFILGLEFCNTDKSTDLWRLVGSDPTLPELAERLKSERSEKSNPLVKNLAFVLMPNHIHLILQEIKEGGISKYMQKLGGYSTYFNQQYKRTGSLFQSRFKSVLIKDDNQLNNVFVYLHSNPVELWESGWKDFKVKNQKQAIKKLAEYWPSSYNDYVGEPRFPRVVDKKFFLDFYGSKKDCRQVVEDWISFKAQETEIAKKTLE